MNCASCQHATHSTVCKRQNSVQIWFCAWLCVSSLVVVWKVETCIVMERVVSIVIIAQETLIFQSSRGAFGRTVQQWLQIKQDISVTFYCSIKFHISLVDYQKAKWLIFQCDVSLFLVGMNTFRYSMAIFYSNFFLLCNVFLSDKPPFVKYYEFDVSDKTESHKNVAIVIRHTPSHLQTNSVWKLAGYESTLVLVWKVVTWGIFMGESRPVVCIFKYLILTMWTVTENLETFD